MRWLILLVACTLLAAGCGSSDESGETGTETQTATHVTTGTDVAKAKVLVYHFADRQAKVDRVEVEAPAVARGALQELVGGGFLLSIENGVATVTGLEGLSEREQAEIVFTLTQFPTVQKVDLGDGPKERGDFEGTTPAIVVESPVAGDHVTSPLRITGSADTFEATFQVEIQDDAGKQLAKDFVTATSGSGTRGTFDKTIPYTGSGPGKLVVYEISAEDGSRVNEQEIPLDLG